MLDPRETRIEERLASVIVRYRGRVEPVKFLWGNREIWVAQINTKWRDKDRFTTWWSVTSRTGEIYILRYRDAEPYWWLESVIT